MTITVVIVVMKITNNKSNDNNCNHNSNDYNGKNNDNIPELLSPFQQNYIHSHGQFIIFKTPTNNLQTEQSLQ